MTDNIIHMDFNPDVTTTDTPFYEIETDKPDSDPVFVSVHTEGIELVQQGNEIFITDGQLAGIIQLLVSFDEEEDSHGE